MTNRKKAEEIKGKKKKLEQQRDLERKPLVGRRGYGDRPEDRRQPEAQSPQRPHTVKLGTKARWKREEQRREKRKVIQQGEKEKVPERDEGKKRKVHKRGISQSRLEITKGLTVSNRKRVMMELLEEEEGKQLSRGQAAVLRKTNPVHKFVI